MKLLSFCHLVFHSNKLRQRKATACLLMFVLFAWLLPQPVAQAQTVPIVLPPTFSVEHGFFTSPFQVTLSTSTAGATIRYTTDGTTPSKSTGTVYGGPITIATTTPLRAVAYQGNDQSTVGTQTYIFLQQVRTQSSTPLPGWPNFFSATDSYGPYPADYEMDPAIVNHANYTNKLEGALQAVPTLSLVTDLANLWSPSYGIYYNPNEKSGDPNSKADPLNNKWERPISLEWINPDGTPGFSEMAGARIHGQGTRRPQNTPKHSFRIAFKKQYGVGKLNFALFDFADPVGQVDGLVLRMGGNRSWSYYDRDQRREADYVNDEWARRTWLQMGHLTGRGTYVQLYVNGVYWGLYNVAERLDEKFLAAYLGGVETDYDYIVSDEDLGDVPTAQAGTLDAFNQLVNLLSGTTPISDATYQQVAQRMDLVDFADYLLHVHYLGKTDWPNHNWNAYRKRTGPDTRFRWMPWDNDSGLNKVNQAWDVTNAALDYPQSPSWMFLRLITNAEFRQLFADRIYKHVVSPDGVLAPANCASIYTDLTNKIDQAVIAESARWGDYVRDLYNPPSGALVKLRPAYLYSRDLPADDAANYLVQSSPPLGGTIEKKNWVQVRADKLNTYCPGRSDNLLSQYVAGTIHVGSKTLNIPLYQTTLVPPTYSQRGGAVSANYNLVISNPNNNVGDIYYTTDGSDPRVAGGAVSPTAINGADGAQLLITQVLNVKARVKDGANWSPLIDYMFYPPQPFANLVINEIHYHPTAPVGQDGDDYEFIELYNRGATTLQLDNVAFTHGFSYHFPVGATIAPNQYLVLVSNPIAFSTRYPGVTPFGTLRGHISNLGERIKLVDAVGNEIDSVTYTDLPPWPIAADGTGPSLELMNPGWDNALVANWRASTVMHGTPGAQNSTFLVSLPPTVTLTSPLTGSTFLLTQPVTLTALASDPEGTIAQVTFLVDGTPLANCTDTVAPYQCSWTPAKAGAYKLTAEATDAQGIAALSAAVTIKINDVTNTPPSVAISSPTNGAMAVTDSTVQVVASAGDTNGSVTKVIFLVDGEPILGCEDTTAPYECAWTPTKTGVYRLTAQATDNENAQTTSAPVSFTVVDKPNIAPTVAITSPATSATVRTGKPTTIVAVADDADGTVANVTFFADGAPIVGCVDAAAPYECNWTPPTDGTYVLTAQAVDDRNAQTLSGKVNVTAVTLHNQLPTAEIVSPVAGSGFQEGKNVIIRATASDPDGVVVKVVFFANNTPIDNCIATTAPYECTWTPAKGNYSLSVQATDDEGAVSDMPSGSSLIITISAVENRVYMPFVVR